MIDWKKNEAGSYYSSDERFRIYRSWNRVYGRHWVLIDSLSRDEYKEDSMKESKEKAERIASR